MKMKFRMCLFFLLLPAAYGQGTPLRLSLKDAVNLALAPEGNTRMQLAREMIKQAEMTSAEARAALLPDLESSFTARNLTQDLASFGINLQIPIPGFQFPNFVGPFTVVDARATVSQTVFDFSSIRRYQASRVGIQVAKAENDSTRSQTIGQVARAYLAALRAKAALEAARANVELAGALLRLSRSEKAAGTGTGIEVIRAQVQLANEQQLLLVADTDAIKAKLELLRVIGLDLDRPIELSGELSYQSVEGATAEQALATARASRPELKAQQRREESARLTYSATKMERLPSVSAFGDYGSIGTGVDNLRPTRTYGMSLRVPLFDGGRRDARRVESLSVYRQEAIRTHDVKQQVELEVREAIESLKSAESQVKTAEDGLQLSERELEQAQRRYKAGVTTSVEVIDAETRLERARDNRIAALFNQNLARIDLETARGTAERLIQ